jgi:uncharacterized protein (DUF39 family)/NAD-dependent dihydropyrimidine dehydrogenase PreA subunit
VNTTDKTIYTYMGKLLPNMGNATFSGAGAIAPILNDPSFQTIGIGTRIFLGGGEGYVIGNGTQHNPRAGFSTLMVQGDLKCMSSEYIKGAIMTKYGCTLFVGLGVPIPILNTDVAKSTGILDDQIRTNVYDYAEPTRSRTSLREVTYGELKSGGIEINGQEVKTAPISSFRIAEQISEELKKQIASGKFLLSSPATLLSTTMRCRPMEQHVAGSREVTSRQPPVVPEGQSMIRLNERCVHCGLCITYCVEGVFRYGHDGMVVVDPDLCTECELCRDICPHRAIGLRS